MFNDMQTLDEENLPDVDLNINESINHNFTLFQKKYISRVTAFLTNILAPAAGNTATAINETPLLKAMQYAVLNGGKRIRPLLVYATGLSLGASPQHLDAAAASIELIHCYSLIHDDLPAMDNDDLRRGKPTCHIAFDEATAILAGDALQALGFEVLADPRLNPLSDKHRLEMLLALSKAAGIYGMVGGQAMDMANTGVTQKTDVGNTASKIQDDKKEIYSDDLNKLCQIHQKKTGALIETAIKFGALTVIDDENYLAKLSYFASTLGLLFQVQDDILDVESNTETLGKTQGKDSAQNKLTFPTLMGLSEAKDFSAQLLDECHTSLHELSLTETPLHKLVKSFVTRTY